MVRKNLKCNEYRLTLKKEGALMQGFAKDNELTIEWLRVNTMHRVLQDIVKLWGENRGKEENLKLGLIHAEIWMAQQTLQPFPHISVAKNNEGTIVGIMCGVPIFDHFFLQYMTTHPLYSHIRNEIEERLIESAIDESASLGFRGWVACSPAPGEETFWRSHGFFKQDDRFYRRMGYFASA